MAEVVDDVTLRLHELSSSQLSDLEGFWDGWSENDLEIKIHRMEPANPQEFTDRVSWAVAHELGHLLGLGHVCDTIAGECVKPNPPGGANLMNYRTSPSVNRFMNIPAKYDMELRQELDGFVWRSDINHFEQVRNSFSYFPLQGEFFQSSDSNIDGLTYLESFEQAVSQGGFLDESDEVLDFTYPPPVRQQPPPPTQGSVDGIAPGDIAVTLTAGFNNLRQNLISEAVSQFNLGEDALPTITANFGDVFELTDALQGTVNSVDVATAVSMDELTEQLSAIGFTVDKFIDDSDFENLSIDQPADFIQVSRSYPLLDMFREVSYSNSATSSLSELGDFDLSGAIGIDGQAMSLGYIWSRHSWLLFASRRDHAFLGPMRMVNLMFR